MTQKLEEVIKIFNKEKSHADCLFHVYLKVNRNLSVRLYSLNHPSSERSALLVKNSQTAENEANSWEVLSWINWPTDGPMVTDTLKVKLVLYSQN